MLKHLDDKGDVHVIIDDSGAVLFVCSLCGNTRICRCPRGPSSTDTDLTRGLVASLEAHSDTVAAMGLDARVLMHTIQSRESDT